MSAAVWDDLTEPLGERIAALLRQMADDYENSRDRSKQTAIGPSGLGKPCTRCLAREVLGCPVTRTFDDPWCRIIGTAVHAWLDEASVHANVKANRADWYAEMKVYPDDELLPKGGNADLYHVPTATVIDHKIVGAARLKHYRAQGPGPQYRRQAHLYGAGFAKLGKPVGNVAVAFWNRGGRLRDLYVWTEAYDPAIAAEALARFRTIRDLALSTGKAVLPLLPADPDCWDCEGRDVTPEELLP